MAIESLWKSLIWHGNVFKPLFVCLRVYCEMNLGIFNLAPGSGILSTLVWEIVVVAWRKRSSIDKMSLNGTQGDATV